MQGNMFHRFVSLLVILALTLGMLGQFHHHDHDGNVFISLSSINDFALGGLVEQHIDHCHHRDGASQERSAHCSLHIDKFFRQYDPKNGALSLISVDNFYIETYDFSIQCNNILLFTDYRYRRAENVPLSCVVRLSALRAPPMV